MDIVAKIIYYVWTPQKLWILHVYAAVTELEDNEFNDPEFSANAHWLSCGEVYKKFSILLISIQDALETKEIPMEYSITKNIFKLMS